MPRVSGSNKRTSGAGQRDTRHENGLVRPAKRVQARKSQGQLDGSGSGRSGSDPGPVQAGPAAVGLPVGNNNNIDGSNGSLTRADSVPDGNSLGGHKNNLGNSGHDISVNGNGRSVSVEHCCDETSSESGGSTGMAHTTSIAVDGSHRQIDVNAMKNADVHRDSGPFDLATTVLKALPMQDTLAILIILMHVPSVSLSFIYAAFTFLTFVPPVTTSSGMNINFAEIFDGNSTTPSLVTVACMDVFFLLFWLFLWQPLQDAILDLAKPVIAITLGGGTGARDGTSRGLTTCFTWVLVHHLLRGTKAHWSRFVRHIPEDWPVPAVLQQTLESVVEPFDKRGPFGWVKSILAIHILTQGVVRYVKEWYLRREKVSALANLNDPEVGKAPSNAGDSVSSEVTFAGPDPEAGAAQTPAPPLAMSKKRRKQSTQIRLQQPLWAALASTKIVVMKEYELSQTATEQAGSNATDIHNLGNAPFDRQPGQIWISYVGSDEVCFNTSYFPEHDYETASKASRHDTPTVIAPEKPFHVRVNNAFWQPTRISAVDSGEGAEEEEEGTRWTGDIYGLRPASKYVCEFVCAHTGEVIFKTSIRTIQEPQRESEGGQPTVTDDQRSLRPDSPATTLKTSIAAAEARLAEERSRLKTSRKEWKTRINALRKDNELLDNQLSSAGNHDDKYRQKIKQQETQKMQAERDAETLIDQLKNFDTSPELQDRRKKMERAYAAEKKLFDAAKKEFEKFKVALEKEVKNKELEKSALVTRANKIRTRISKVETELANIKDANNRGLDEAERRRQERALWEDQSKAISNNYRDRIHQTRNNNVVKSEQIQQLEGQVKEMQDFLSGVASGMGTYDMFPQPHPQQQQQQQQQGGWNMNPAAPPHVPLGIPPGLWGKATPSSDMNPSLAAAVSGPSTWQPPPTAAPFEPSRSFKTRGRSSSMLSDISGFTQSSGEQDSPMASSTAVGAPAGFGGAAHQPFRRLLPAFSPLGAQRYRGGGGGSSGDGSGGNSIGEPHSPV
ncbi:hypothetical protein N3K66_007884 [Trichothecium roseum]|uniref:Uncharacterized protein n=1 Tax=Trichothecium roseum TaxID=47278 RepID=A0ACC0UTM1_9HYPO|nr:hypothetical protein N3K66_007884 [Trichothecium roseum]